MQPGEDNTHPGILASAATGIADHVARLGGDIDRVCGEAGVDPASVGQPTLSLELSAFCSLFEEAARFGPHRLYSCLLPYPGCSP
jgi:hypothetical protein